MRRCLMIAVLLALLAGLALVIPHSTGPSPMEKNVSAAELGMMLLESDEGVSVLAVRDGSRAEQAGIRPTDLLTQVNSTPFCTVDELDALLQRQQAPVLNMRIVRADEPVMVQIKLNHAIH